MFWKEAADMEEPINIGLATGKRLHFIFFGISLVLSGWAFNVGAQTVTILHSIGSSSQDGIFLGAGLVQGSDGNLYGTTQFGGTNFWGAVFRISPNGSYTNFYSFTGPPNDGAFPLAGLTKGNDGNFYGTTTFFGGYGSGTVFRISPNGNYTNLYSIVKNCETNGLVLGTDGNLYGMIDCGGMSGQGIVFQISSSGNYTDLYSFGSSPNDGAQPQGVLIQSGDGNFYGTTSGGGMSGQGTVFRISSSGIETTLYSFAYSFFSNADGATPEAGLTQGSDGDLYGTTLLGGANNHGTVFRISSSGTYTSLYSFVGSPTDGSNPLGGLVQGSDGNFYGTTSQGGTNNRGTMFRISSGGEYTNMYSFGGYPTDGAAPQAGLVQGSDGNFYGTTVYGGTNGAGTVFKLTVSLNPPANQVSGIQITGVTNHIVIIPSVAYETYQLEFSSSMNPANWVNVPGASITNSIGAFLTVTNLGGALSPQGFYRFDITP